MIHIITPEVLQALVALVSTLLVVGITRAGHFLSQKLATDRQRAILERVERAATTAVLATQQRFVDVVKEGKLSGQDAGEALERALTIARAELGAAGLAELRRALGTDTDAVMADYVEAAVAKLKAGAL